MAYRAATTRTAKQPAAKPGGKAASRAAAPLRPTAQKMAPAPSRTPAAPRPKPAPAKPPLDAAFDRLLQVGVTNGADQDLDFIQAPSFEALAKDLGIDIEDPIFLALLWKMDCQTPQQIGRDEWKAGAKELGAKDVAGMKSALSGLRKEIKDPQKFKAFYGYVFSFVREGVSGRVLDIETATGYWSLMFGIAPHRWPELELWCRYITEVHRKPVTMDLWKLVLDFSTAKIQDYDDTSAWPVAIDEFVDFYNEQKK